MLSKLVQSASARDRFFLTAPELSRLSEEAHHMAGTQTAKNGADDLKECPLIEACDQVIFESSNICNKTTFDCLYSQFDVGQCHDLALRPQLHDYGIP